MFFPEPVRALREMRRVTLPSGKVVVQLWGSLDERPAYRILVDVAARCPDRCRRATQQLLGARRAGDPAVTLRRGGAGHRRFDRRTGTVRFDSIEEFVRVEVEATPLIDRLDDDLYARLRDLSLRRARRVRGARRNCRGADRRLHDRGTAAPVAGRASSTSENLRRASARWSPWGSPARLPGWRGPRRRTHGATARRSRTRWSARARVISSTSPSRTPPSISCGTTRCWRGGCTAWPASGPQSPATSTAGEAPMPSTRPTSPRCRPGPTTSVVCSMRLVASEPCSSAWPSRRCRACSSRRLIPTGSEALGAVGGICELPAEGLTTRGACRRRAASRDLPSSTARLNGTGELASLLAPSRANEPGFRAWLARCERLGLRPANCASVYAQVFQPTDLRTVVRTIARPTLVLARP